MPIAEQPILVDIPEQPEQKAKPLRGELKLRSVNREQTMLVQIYVEDLVAADHKVRAIWELVKGMDLTRFTEPLRTTKGCAGRAAWNPQLLVSLWVYAYKSGVSAAREHLTAVLAPLPGVEL